jgi:hypothetical protein
MLFLQEILSPAVSGKVYTPPVLDETEDRRMLVDRIDSTSGLALSGSAT